MRTLPRPMRWALAMMLALFLCVSGGGVAHACTQGGCVTAGPRLASVSTNRSAVLGSLMGNLLGTSVDLTVIDWNTIATGNINAVDYLSALQNTLNVSNTSTALTTNASVAQLVTAAASAATGEGNPTLAAALNGLSAAIPLLPGTVKLGDLLTITGGGGTSQINALELVTGIVQLYNYKNVLTTPSPVTISATSLGLVGVLNNVSLQAQVIEPPVYVCGPVGSTFHTAGIRVKLDINLVTINLDVSTLAALGLTVSANITQLGIYVDVARADGILTAVDAVSNALTVQATPGVADLYLGTIADATFFNRTRTLNRVTDLTWGNIGTITVSGVTVAIQVMSYANGQAPVQRTLTFSGPYPQTKTAQTSAVFSSNLVTGLVNNLQLQLSPSLGLLNGTITALLKPIVTGVLGPLLTSLLSGLVDPLLELLGIRLGEVDVTVGGASWLCTIAGNVYGDVNHSALKEYAESGTGLSLYAKIVYASTPSNPAIQVATVDPTTGTYSFSYIPSGSYQVLVDTTATQSDVTVTMPTGWIGTEVPTMTRAITVSATDFANQNYGLYNGSTLTGTVFKDDGAPTGTANNATKDGTEVGIPGVTVKVTDNAGAVTYDTATAGTGGTFTLWIPASAGANLLKITEANVANYFSTGGGAGTTAGAYAIATDTVTFTNVIGTTYSGVTFADVIANRFEPDGRQSILPGAVAYYRHTFVAGSAGQVTLATSATATRGWSQLLYNDANCNGAVDAGEAVISSAIALTTGQTLCIVAKVLSPDYAALNTQYPITVSASFTYANSALSDAKSRNDLTTTGNAADAGLRLTKTVDRATAKTGDTLTYSITYSNAGDASLGNLKIYDSTPAYTVFGSAACGTLGTGISGCSVSTQPAAGNTGALVWQFTGTLSPGASGAVSFTVTVQ